MADSELRLTTQAPSQMAEKGRQEMPAA